MTPKLGQYRGSVSTCECGWELSILREGGNLSSGWRGCLNPQCECSVQAGMVLRLKAKTQNGGGCRRQVAILWPLCNIPRNVASDMQGTLVQVLGVEALARIPVFAT